ncbi:MAG: SUMF1/EgtB/PvdO family nonheme iron enzyme [Ferruginibacter sp.]
MKKIFLLFAFTCTLFTTKANNILVTNASLSGQNTTTHSTLVNFDVSWENSWRTSTNENNYDGAWIFVKFRKNGTTDWRHATINITGNTPASGATVTVPADGKGAFIYRSANGIGNINYTANVIRWNYGADGILDNETVEILVYGLEMVYIPTGSYQLGSGGSETNAFSDGASAVPYLVTSNNAINLGTTAGTLNPNGAGAATGTIPAAFPKGYNAYWIMKYECSQQQYVDFLNNLDLARATQNQSPTIFTGVHPALIAPQPERAIGQLGTNKLAAFADWSGLRPMSELEFEKACRGYNTPAVPNEFAWGNTTIVAVNAIINDGAADETVSVPLNANACIALGLGNRTVRTGIFARTTGSDRTLSGATYYGVMNMSDNVHEICFSMVNAQGKAIDASIHGNGYLGADGKTDIPAWLPFQAYGLRGGSYNSPVSFARVSDRAYDNLFTAIYGADTDQPNFGIRLTRTAP